VRSLENSAPAGTPASPYRYLNANRHGVERYEMPKPWSADAVNRLVNATIHSLRGLRYTIANETAVRHEAITLGLAILLGFSLSPGPAWYVAMIGVLLVLLAVELLNTAIEKLSDHVTCVYRKLMLGRNGDEVRPGWRMNRSHRFAEPGEKPAHLHPRPSGSASHHSRYLATLDCATSNPSLNSSP
jgi:diacylglycerol kinase (ATP)